MNVAKGSARGVSWVASGLLTGVALIFMISCSNASSEDKGEASRAREVVRAVLDRVESVKTGETDGGEIHYRGIELGGEERAAFQVHAPQVVMVREVAVPPGGRLHLAVGVLDHPNLHTGDGVELAVAVVASGAREEVWKRHLDPGRRPEDRGWLDVEIPLDRWAGASVDLLLEAHPGENRRLDRAAWSGLLLVGDAEEPELGVIRRSIQLAQLKPDGTTLLEVPRHSALAVSGMVVRGRGTPASLEPVTYWVRVDEETVWERAVSTNRRRNGFTVRIPMDAWAGKEAYIGFEIELPGEGAQFLDARWADLALVTEELIPRQPAGRGPNILFVVVDTLRADHLSAYGYERETSPILDALAAEGAMFENAISQSSWTMPATASLATGLYPTEHGVTDGQALPLQLHTLSELAQDRGLTTLGISANPLIGEGEGFAQGHERFVHVPWARAEAVNDLLVQMVREYGGSQWFAYVHYIDPHDPYTAPEPFGSSFRRTGLESRYADQEEFRKLVDAVNFDDGRAEWDDDDREYLEAAYDGEIRYWDAELEKLLARLRNLGVLDDTIIIVTSDHGEEFLEHGRLKHGLHLYEESVRVPLVIHGPGIVPGFYEAPVETRKLFDLCLALLSASSNGGTVAPQEILRSHRNLVFAHTDHGRTDESPTRVELAAVSDGRWKLIDYPGSERRELYDLSIDDAETQDVSHESPSVAGRYLRLLEAWLKSTSATDAPDAERDDQIIEKLKALGYIQ